MHQQSFNHSFSFRHECEGEGGKKKFFKPPKKYMRRHLAAGDFDRSGAVNVDDMANVTKVARWR